MPSILIKNISTLVTGDLNCPLRRADSIYVEDRVIRAIGNELRYPADIVVDAHGITAIPGLVDSHSHPTIGDFTPTQNSLSWITRYMHCGVTALISAGEFHIPGLRLPPDPKTALSLSFLAKHCWDNFRPSGVKVYGGPLLLVPGIKESDFDEIRAAGIRLVKFIFYDYSLLPNGEAERYVRWARNRDIKVKIHSGGVSRLGVSQMAGVEIAKRISPDIIGHINGGPNPMGENEMEQIVAETDFYLEICSSGSTGMILTVLRAVKTNGAFHRVLIGTDTPGGGGIIPRGMLREIALLSSAAEVPPEMAICMATGNVGRAHDLPIGIVEEKKAADIVLLDKVQGSPTNDALNSFAKGDLPGVSLVMIDGEIQLAGRSQQTPPPERSATVETKIK